MSVLAVTRKELRQLSRDVRTLAVLLLFPALLLLLYGYVVTFEARNVKLAVLDYDLSPASRALAASVDTTEHFQTVLQLGSDLEIMPVLRSGRASVVLVLPQGFGASLAAGRPVEAQAMLDGSDAMIARAAQSYLEQIVAAYGARLSAEPAVLPIDPRLRVLYNPELASDRFLVPGLIAFILMIASCVTTSLSVVRERETGTMELLLVSPLTPRAVITGKALPYGAIAMVAAVLVLATARVAFGLRIEGSHLLLALATVLFIAGAQGLGLLISSVTSSQMVAFLASTFATVLPTFLLSGFVFPIRSMPPAIQAITVLIPGRYYIAAMRAIVLKGVGLEAVWGDLLALVVFSAATLTFASWRVGRIRL
jgi:ABC-2 type transport system permease protein